MLHRQGDRSSVLRSWASARERLGGWQPRCGEGLPGSSAATSAPAARATTPSTGSATASPTASAADAIHGDGCVGAGGAGGKARQLRCACVGIARFDLHHRSTATRAMSWHKDRRRKCAAVGPPQACHHRRHRCGWSGRAHLHQKQREPLWAHGLRWRHRPEWPQVLPAQPARLPMRGRHRLQRLPMVLPR